VPGQIRFDDRKAEITVKKQVRSICIYASNGPWPA